MNLTGFMDAEYIGVDILQQAVSLLLQRRSIVFSRGKGFQSSRGRRNSPPPPTQQSSKPAKIPLRPQQTKENGEVPLNHPSNPERSRFLQDGKRCQAGFLK